MRRSEALKELLDYWDLRDSSGVLNLANEIQFDWEVENSEDHKIFVSLWNELDVATVNEVHALKLTVTGQQFSAPDRVRMMVEHIRKLSPQLRDAFLEQLQHWRVDAKQAAVQPTSEHVEEALDRHWSRELVGLIPGIVSRISLLSDIRTASIPHPTVDSYFREAHRCYLFGLYTACTVFCRAILESALKDRFGANNTFQELIERAEQTKGLDGERIECAERIYSAGNLAIHQHQRFAARYSMNDVYKFLLGTRKVIEDLYRPETASAQ